MVERIESENMQLETHNLEDRIINKKRNSFYI